MEKNKLMMIVIIVLLLLLLGTIVGVSVFALRYVNNRNIEEASLDSPKATTVKQLKPDEIKEVPLLDPLSANLMTGADGVEHVIRVKISTGIDNTDKKQSPITIATVTANDTIIRDLAIDVLKKTTYQELSRPDGNDILKDRLLKRIQETFADNLIVTVYLSEMYLQ